MKLKKLILLLFFGIIGFNKINAFIYNIKVLDNGNQKLILCSDVHISDQVISGYSFNHHLSAVAAGRGLPKFINLKQAMQFCAALECFHADNSLVIVEDFSHSKSKNPIIEKCIKEQKKHYKDYFSGMFLPLISLISLNQNIEFINCEMRYILSADFGFDIFGCYRTGEIVKDVESFIKELSSYNDGETLNKFYLEISQQYLSQHYFGRRRVALDGDFWDSLFDAKLLHVIYNNPEKKYIFVCAGGWHIQNISDVLLKMNYHEIMNFGFNENINDSDLTIEQARRMDPVNMQECMEKILKSNGQNPRSRL